MRHFVSLALVLGVAAAAQASDLDLCVVEQGGSCPAAPGNSTITVPPDCDVPFAVVGELSDMLNEGLAFVTFDLSFSGGDLDPTTIDLPTEDPMLNYLLPLGINNPDASRCVDNPGLPFCGSITCPPDCGFRGTLVGGDLIQLLGGQNTFRNTDANAPFPTSATVITGIAWPGSPQTFISGMFHVPAGLANGPHELSLISPLSNVILDGETGIPLDEHWKTEKVDAFNISNLTVMVDASAACSFGGPLCEVASDPADEGTLPRFQNHVIRLSFVGSVPAPNPGDIKIQPLLANGAYGTDVSADFTFTLENADLTLRIANGVCGAGADAGSPCISDTGCDGVCNNNSLANETWYGIVNDGSWAGVSPFAVDLAVVFGDVNDSTATDVNDVPPILANRGNTDDGIKYDVNGNGVVDVNDVPPTLANRGSARPTKPGGHDCTPLP